MRTFGLAASALALAVAFAGSAFAQGAPQAAPPGPYKPVAVKVAPLVSDPSLDAFRKELAAVAQRMVLPQGHQAICACASEPGAATLSGGR